MKKIYSFFDIKKPSSESLLFFCNMNACCFDDYVFCDILYRGGSIFGARIIPILTFLYSNKRQTLILNCPYNEDIINYIATFITIPAVIITLENNMCSTMKNSSHIQMLLPTINFNTITNIEATIITDSITELAQKLNKTMINQATIIKQSNSKKWLFDIQKENNLPHLATIVIDNHDAIIDALSTLKAQGYTTACIKTEYGTASLGMQQIPLTDKLMPFIPHRFLDQEMLIIQGWLDESIHTTSSIGSPAVQAYINDEGPFIFGITEQILDNNNIYIGCYAPVSYRESQAFIEKELCAQAYTILNELYEIGYRGPVGIDFVITKQDNIVHIMACDINTRITASMPPLILAEYLQPGCIWVNKKIILSSHITSQSLLEQLKTLELLYTSSNKKGIFPYFYSNTSESIALIVCINYTPQEAHEVVKHLSDILTKV